VTAPPISAPVPAPSQAPRRSLRRAGLSFALLLLLLAAGFVVVRFTPLGDYLTAERIQATLAGLRDLWWSPFVLVGLILVLGAVGAPATPFLIAGAAIFGAYWGTVWNFVGVLAASCAGYGLARLLGREFVERIGGAKIKRAEQMLHRRGFLPLVAVRFLPIPFPLVNAAAAVVGVRFPKFFAASVAGLLPPVAILTYFSARLLDAATGDRTAILGQLLAVTLTAALIIFFPIGLRRYRRRKRLRRHRATRAARRGRSI
jgi:uncharacterized membrane protein YdjX (TVP38/TMEM64 family)